MSEDTGIEGTLESAADLLSARGPSGYPFRPLGYGDGHYYVVPSETLQVAPIPAGAVTSRAHLLSIAPLEWWESRFSGKQGTDWTMAANALIRWCEAEGVFDAASVRGRGAWFDDSRSVLHLGHELVCDGRHTPIAGFQTRYVYERQARLEIHSDIDPLPKSDARRLRDIMDALCWERPVSAILVAGWAYIAPICGALKWRPHLWVTGQKGSGKSWVLEQIIRPCIGSAAVIVQSNSTEAGIRQQMRQDARPVIFDEAESESRRDAGRIQSVIELARQASSENSAAIAKGTTGGRAMLFRVRSMFCMGSINIPLQQAADVSRFTVCTLRRHDNGASDQFDRLEAAVREIVTPEFCERLRARAYRDIPTIRHNAILLGRAVAKHINDQRQGDQLGTLLAGAYGLKNDGRITPKSAEKMIESLDWSDHHLHNSGPSDQRRLMDEILSARVRYEGERTVSERTIGELISATQGEIVDGVDRFRVPDLLERYGIKVRGSEVLVANSHRWIREALADTPWANSWAPVLGYAEGAERSVLARVGGNPQRCVLLRADWVIGRDFDGEK